MPSHPSSQDIKVATDAVIFTVRDGKLCVLLIGMKKEPLAGLWAVPGGLIGEEETTKACATRILREQTGIADVYLEQLATFDDPARDPYGRVISVAYFALTPSERVELRTTEKYADVRWWPVAKLPKLAYDHKGIVATALTRLRNRLAYTNIAWSLLPAEFPLSRLQETYEAILGRELDKRNFRKKILETGIVEATGRMTAGGAHRPAELHRFKKRALAYVEMLPG
jgi:8-oxo-dGTP diphosphatase